MPKKTAKKIIEAANKRTRAANTTFARATPAQKRVIIAKDVIAALNSRKIVATTGLYVDEDPLVDVVLTEKDLDKDYRQVLPKLEECQACAVGSMFLCAVKRADNLPLRETNLLAEIQDNKEWGDGKAAATLAEVHPGFHSYLTRFFDRDQIYLMENAFEQSSIHERVRVVCLYGDDEERLRMIMENVVRNRGRFQPNDRKMLAQSKAKWQEDSYADY